MSTDRIFFWSYHLTMNKTERKTPKQNEQGKQKMNKAVNAVINGNQGKMIELTRNSNIQRSTEYNRQPNLQGSGVFTNAFVSQGIPPTRITAISSGESRPVYCTTRSHKETTMKKLTFALILLTLIAPSQLMAKSHDNDFVDDMMKFQLASFKMFHDTVIKTNDFSRRGPAVVAPKEMIGHHRPGHHDDYRNKYYDRKTVINVQRKLRTLGFYPYEIDGIIGFQTTRALRQYQRFNHLPVTGVLTPVLIDHMFYPKTHVNPHHSRDRYDRHDRKDRYDRCDHPSLPVVRRPMR